MTDPQNDNFLELLLQETSEDRKAIAAVLKSSPEDMDLHRLNNMYLSQILNIRKAMLQEKALDREQLLIDALKTVVHFLIEHREVQAARFIGEHLEEIGLKVKSHWQDSKPSPNLQRDTKPSEKPSRRPSPLSETQPPREKESEDSGLL